MVIVIIDELDIFFEKFIYWKMMKICVWMMWFVYNVCLKMIGRLKGLLIIEEINKVKIFWVKRV